MTRLLGLSELLLDLEKLLALLLGFGLELALFLVNGLLHLRIVISVLQISLHPLLGDRADLNDLNIVIRLGLHIHLVLSQNGMPAKDLPHFLVVVSNRFHL